MIINPVTSLCDTNMYYTRFLSKSKMYIISLSLIGSQYKKTSAVLLYAFSLLKCTKKSQHFPLTLFVIVLYLSISPP